MESKRKVLQKLFLSTLYLSAFTFGGGYVIVTLMKKKFVDEYHWIEENEMLDLVAIAQSSPGPIAVNGAIVVGYKLAGMVGVLVSIIGTIIPPFLIISVISVCYQAFRDNFFVSQMLEGMQAGVGAVIASVTYEMGAGVVKEKDKLSLVILVGAFAAACFFSVNVIYIVLICGAIGAVRNDLFSAIFKLFPDRPAQLRRRLCGHAADSGTGGAGTRLAVDVGVYGSDYHLPDDAGADRSQFGYVRRN